MGIVDQAYENMPTNNLKSALKEHGDKAMRFNEGKLQWSLVHYKSLEPLVRVMMYGAKKYAPENWKNQMDRQQILNSMMRHVAALIDGEQIDAESQELHIGHIMANAMFWQYHNEQWFPKEKG